MICTGLFAVFFLRLLLGLLAKTKNTLFAVLLLLSFLISESFIYIQFPLIEIIEQDSSNRLHLIICSLCYYLFVLLCFSFQFEWLTLAYRSMHNTQSKRKTLYKLPQIETKIEQHQRQTDNNNFSCIRPELTHHTTITTSIVDFIIKLFQFVQARTFFSDIISSFACLLFTNPIHSIVAATAMKLTRRVFLAD